MKKLTFLSLLMIMIISFAAAQTVKRDTTRIGDSAVVVEQTTYNKTRVISNTVTYDSTVTRSYLIALSVPIPNVPPVANAGPDKTITFITLPVSVTLNGSGTDADGTIISYLWAQISGGGATMITPATAATTNITGLTQGTYVFRLIVTDNKGATATDDVTVAVVAAANQSPTANAGPDQTITLPVSSVTLTGSGLDADGTIASYAWAKASGGVAIISPADAATTTVSGLAQGTYVFRLTVTDNRGAIASDNVSVVVNPQLTPPPVDTSGIKIDGYGSQATGGQAFKANPYHVTTTAASGPGSLANGIKSNAYIVFDVSGTINASISVSNVSFLTIDASTAPYPGIIITSSSGDGLSIMNASHHVIVNSLILANCSGDGGNVLDAAHDVGITNCTFYGNGDGNFDVAWSDQYKSVQRNVTIQFCIYGNNKGKSKNNSGGCLVTQGPVTFHHNLTNDGVNNTVDGVGQDGERNPFAHSNYGEQPATPQVDAVNNLLWNWGRNNATGTGYGIGIDYKATANAVNNYGKTKSSAAVPIAKGTGFITNNVDVGTGIIAARGNVSGNGVAGNNSTTLFTVPAPFQVAAQSACDAALTVLAKAGTLQRDANGKHRTEEQIFIDGIAGNLTGCSNTPPPPGNQSPTANAGTDKTVTLPATSVTLAGSGSDPDGTIASYLWTKVSGPGTTSIANNTGATALASNLEQGTYVFNLTVTDDKGATATDNVTVTVVAAGGDGGGNVGYTLVYSTGYDNTNDLDPFNHGQIGNGSLSTTIFATGPGSFKSVPANVSSGIRSEVQYGSGQTPLEGIVEYDVYYDNFFSDNGHSLQWHPTTSGGSGTGLYHKGGKIQFVTVKSGTSGTNVGPAFSVSTKTWHHIKLTYKFGSSGYIKVELDAVVVVPQTNVQMGDGSSPYLKVGVNMWVNQTSVVYYDNLKVYKK